MEPCYHMIVVSLLLICFSSTLAQKLCNKKTGDHEGYFYSHYKDGGGSACMTLHAKGRYSYSWSNAGNFVGGKGWRTGSYYRVVGYNAGLWNPIGNGYLSLYGWNSHTTYAYGNTLGLIEYYVVDSWGSVRPPYNGEGYGGSVYSDDGWYDIYRTYKWGVPSISKSEDNFVQYWSVRQRKRPTNVNQKITFSNHVNAWAKVGWHMGEHSYQIMATEGYKSSGSSDLSVWEN